jgi:NAD(P)-dependent dehydrogenase (short-subunit alcohol dehydrogenase family)
MCSGPLSMLKAVLPTMRARRSGRIINITSVSGLATWAGTGVYCASKWALEGLTQTLAAEVAELGIKVVNVAPGGMRTDFAGGSKTIVKTKIADYDGLARDAERIMARPRRQRAGRSGQGGPGYPACRRHRRTADASAAGRGRTALCRLRRRRLQTDIDAWKSTTLSIGFDA